MVKQTLELKLVSTELNSENSVAYKIKYRNFFIVKDRDMEINWRKPLIQESELDSKATIHKQPFSQGAMRYAFKMFDSLLNQQLVAKLPKEIDENYNLEQMKKDIETQYIC